MGRCRPNGPQGPLAPPGPDVRDPRISCLHAGHVRALTGRRGQGLEPRALQSAGVTCKSSPAPCARGTRLPGRSAGHWRHSAGRSPGDGAGRVRRCRRLRNAPFAVDGAAMAAQSPGNLALVQALFKPGLDLVVFCRAEVVVSHWQTCRCRNQKASQFTPSSALF